MARRVLTTTTSPTKGNLQYYHVPRGLITLEIFRIGQGAGANFSIEISEEVKLIPDPNHRFFLEYHANPYTSDDIKVTLTKEGFLQSVNTTIKDETGDIVEAVVDLAESVVKGAVGLRGGELVYKETFDPFDKPTMERINKILKSGPGFEVEVRSLKGEKIEPVTSLPAHQGRNGIFCRPVETFEFIVRKEETERRKLLTLPHPYLLHFVEIPVAGFVKSEFELLFDEHGIPTSVKVVKPSQALAFIQVPLNIVKSLLALPGELFKFRIDMAQNKASAAEAVLQSDKKLAEVKAEQAKLAQKAIELEGKNQEVDQMTREVRKLRQDVEVLRNRVN